MMRNHCCQFMWQFFKHVKGFMEAASLQQKKTGMIKMDLSLL
ncbi:protein of unknown function [Xenorhabdus doucetiae]|uniref:Uncharacterized protein n=1 Tax=Xenorhabdus doucetiae TaxID=351671 RepID=A0A068QUR7_9GAMM|nr:protein of unknown function [Xenorhabdus doucetiae]